MVVGNFFHEHCFIWMFEHIRLNFSPCSKEAEGTDKFSSSTDANIGCTKKLPKRIIKNISFIRKKIFCATIIRIQPILLFLIIYYQRNPDNSF